MTILDLIESVISQLTPIAITIAIFAIVVIGFKFVVAAVQGNPTGVQEARKNLLWVLIGTAVVVGANALATAVQSFLSGL
jgi:predicted cobalt transporter CbtA